MKTPNGTAAARVVAVILVIFAATLAVYGQVGDFGFILSDDGDYVYSNPHVKDGLTLEGLSWAFGMARKANWHPLTWLSHMLDVQVLGMDPGRHHLVNVAFHLACTALLFLVFRALTGSFGKSAFVAALFALHPLHVESVAWVSERKDVLSTFFWFLTIGAYLGYLRRPGLARYCLTATFLLLGLMAKSMLVTLPLLLLVLDWWPLGRLRAARDTWRRPLLEKIPLLGLSGIASVFTWQAQKIAGAMVSYEEFPMSFRLANAFVSTVGYLGKTFWPAGLVSFYPHPARSLLVWQWAGAMLFVLAVTALALFLARRFPALTAGWAWYLITLLPVIGLVQVGKQGMADRYTYVPIIGLFLIVAWLAGHFFTKKPLLRRSMPISACIVLALLTFLSWRQASYWRSSRTLMEHAVEVNPKSFEARTRLANVLYILEDYPESERQYRAAALIKPGDATTLNSLGIVLNILGRTDESIARFREALEARPDYALARRNLQRVLSAKERTAP